MAGELHLTVSGFGDSGYEERARMTRALRSELLSTDAETVYHPSATTREGTKGAELEWAQLVVAFGGTLPSLVGAIRSWLGRRPGATISLRIEDDEITIAEPTDAERTQLLEAWLSRHEHE